MSVARDPRALLRRARSRYRRPIAAALAALATVVAISALRPSAPAQMPEASEPASVTRPGDVTVPVPLAVGGDAVQAGDIVDLVAVDESGAAQVVASRVMVIEPTTSFGRSSGAVVLMAMSEPEALAVTSAADQGPLSLLIHPAGTATD